MVYAQTLFLLWLKGHHVGVKKPRRVKHSFLIYNNTYGNPHNHNNENHHPMTNRTKYNIFLFISTFARNLVEVFISLILFKNGFPLSSILQFYLLGTLFSIPVSYLFVRIGERLNYSLVMCFGIVSFAVLQLALNSVTESTFFIITTALLYSLYKRGYWVARRYYVTEVIPQKNSTKPFSIMMVISETASILAGFLGGSLLDGLNTSILTIISSALLFISVIPLLGIKSKTEHTKIELIKKLKKYDKRNILAFSLFEINNILTFLFPIFITIYIKDTYMMAGAVNAISSLAIILFILFYGRIIKKRNYFVLSSILFVLICFAKLFFLDYLILILCFIEGFIKKMQEQSVSKIYFENRNNVDSAHHNLIYQIIEALARAIVTVPLLFMSDVRVMISFVLIVISVELVIYACLRKNQKLS